MLKTSFSSIVSQLHAMLKTGKSCICERSSLARLAPCTAALFYCFIRVVGPMGSLGVEAFRTLVCTKSLASFRSMSLRCSTLSPPRVIFILVRVCVARLLDLFGSLSLGNSGSWIAIGTRSNFLHTPGHARSSARLACRHATSSL